MNRIGSKPVFEGTTKVITIPVMRNKRSQDRDKGPTRPEKGANSARGKQPGQSMSVDGLLTKEDTVIGPRRVLEVNPGLSSKGLRPQGRLRPKKRF